MSARNTTTNLTVARTAGLFLVATAGALTLSTGSASALSPMPGPDLPVVGIEQPSDPEPQPNPGLEGLDELGVPVPTPDPHPVPLPEPEVLDETETTEETAASELAFTGNDLDVLAAGLALLGAGGLAAVGGVVARRRSRAEA